MKPLPSTNWPGVCPSPQPDEGMIPTTRGVRVTTGPRLAHGSHSRGLPSSFCYFKIERKAAHWVDLVCGFRELVCRDVLQVLFAGTCNGNM
ncbi:hypothetical protein HPB48_026398 [Haemaphysalis longicornis]|uniref:Uncharacterized protein n=1 Tax=Haemaphysalis longicornis TaxID=44386 RepID=A0A9J6H115_HAELO|nr:hypothetical protein HPB48_026398 [Haemaphysalis longicornis]